MSDTLFGYHEADAPPLLSRGILARRRGTKRNLSRLGLASLPPSDRSSARSRSALANARQSRAVSCVVRSRFGRREYLRCYTRGSLSLSSFVSVYIRESRAILSIPRRRRKLPSSRRQSCTILSWPREGVKFRPGGPIVLALADQVYSLYLLPARERAPGTFRRVGEAKEGEGETKPRHREPKFSTRRKRIKAERGVVEYFNIYHDEIGTGEYIYCAIEREKEEEERKHCLPPFAFPLFSSPAVPLLLRLLVRAPTISLLSSLNRRRAFVVTIGV